MNVCLSSVFIMALHLFVIYVISKHSPPKMKAYSRYLLVYELITAAMDLTAMWLLAPWFCFPVFGLIPTGLLTTLGVPAEAQGMLGGSLLLFTGLSITELLFQRHQTIVPLDSFLKLKRRKLYAWQVFLVTVATVTLGFASGILMRNECDREGTAKQFPTLRPLVYHEHFLCLGGFGNNMTSVFRIAEAVIVPIILFLLITSIYFLRNNKMFSKKTQDMQRKLLKILIIQTVAPLFFLLVPGALVYYLTLTKDVEATGLNPWILVLFALHGPSSTILILLLYAPYFQFVKNLVCTKSTAANKGSMQVTVTPFSSTSVNAVSVGMYNTRQNVIVKANKCV